MISGALFPIQFFSGWWFLIDALSQYPAAIDATHIILGILGTISLFMVNSVTQAQVFFMNVLIEFLEFKNYVPHS